MKLFTIALCILSAPTYSNVCKYRDIGSDIAAIHAEVVADNVHAFEEDKKHVQSLIEMRKDHEAESQRLEEALNALDLDLNAASTAEGVISSAISFLKSELEQKLVPLEYKLNLLRGASVELTEVVELDGEFITYPIVETDSERILKIVDFLKKEESSRNLKLKNFAQEIKGIESEGFSILFYLNPAYAMNMTGLPSPDEVKSWVKGDDFTAYKDVYEKKLVRTEAYNLFKQSTLKDNQASQNAIAYYLEVHGRLGKNFTSIATEIMELEESLIEVKNEIEESLQAIKVKTVDNSAVGELNHSYNMTLADKAIVDFKIVESRKSVLALSKTSSVSSKQTRISKIVDHNIVASMIRQKNLPYISKTNTNYNFARNELSVCSLVHEVAYCSRFNYGINRNQMESFVIMTNVDGESDLQAADLLEGTAYKDGDVVMSLDGIRNETCPKKEDSN